MTLPTLYSRTSTGAIQNWTIEIQDDAYCTHFGQVDGKQQTTAHTICRPKNEGKANATTGAEQALKEAKALWKKKKDSGCFEDINDIDKMTFTEPMLAKKYEDYADEIEFPVYSQPKLDGCLHEDTIVKTSLGDIKIKDVKVGMSVYTFNETTEKQELKSVVGVYKNGVDVNEAKTEWFKITLENGQDITLTGNHRVWVDNLKCWRRVDELDGTEELKLFHQV
jgi:hypothetical protein